MSAAQLTDCQDIFDLVNEAYEVEIGDDGLAFKNCARFSALNEVEECLDNTWIIRDENGILVGTVRAVSKEEGVIHVGPLAVRKSHQGYEPAEDMVSHHGTDVHFDFDEESDHRLDHGEGSDYAPILYFGGHGRREQYVLFYRNHDKCRQEPDICFANDQRGRNLHKREQWRIHLGNPQRQVVARKGSCCSYCRGLKLTSSLICSSSTDDIL
eukprot:TCALIF_05957-PA protein Name:"Protein of unknown function" AED:0.60 eAED:0.60 QI:0/0/0.33/0.33/1/1/3/0/211